VAPPPASLDGAARLLERVLGEVEADEAQPMRLPPVNVVAYDARGHTAFLAHNGAILIREKSGKVIVDKPGLSGSRVRELAPWLV